jgi:mono/diheme cytochrome c family protein
VLLAWPRAEHIPRARRKPGRRPPANIARGAYLARAGDCMACHTARGGAAYAGGRALDTPFGRVIAPNITPDRTPASAPGARTISGAPCTTASSRGGRLLYPAFPYTELHEGHADDADALFAYLRSLPPVRQPNRRTRTALPYNQQWRWRPGACSTSSRACRSRPRAARLEPRRLPGRRPRPLQRLPQPAQSAGRQRRRPVGRPDPVPAGTRPSLTSDAEAGLGQWTRHVVQLLRTGVSPRGAVFGPMAEVVRHSLQHLSEAMSVPWRCT